MKKRIAVFLLLSLLIISCKTNTNLGKDSIVEINPFFEKNYYKYTSKSDYHIANDTFKVVLFSNVKPLDENKESPQKIYTFQSYYKNSKTYFYKELNGKSISYLKKKNKIIYRHYFQDYKDVNSNESTPKNKEDVIKYLDKNKIKYTLIKSYKESGSDVLDFKIDNKFLKIVATPNFCESYMCYDLKDSINVENYRTIVANFYR
jgi:hypothetical protein